VSSALEVYTTMCYINLHFTVYYITDVQYAIMVSEFVYLGNGVVNNFLGCKVTLVADKQPADVLTCITFNLLKPLLYVVERLLLTNSALLHSITYYSK